VVGRLPSAIGSDLALFALTESEYLSVQLWVGLQKIYASRGDFGEVLVDVLDGHKTFSVLTVITTTVRRIALNR